MKTTIQIKKTDHETLKSYMKQHDIKKSHEGFSKLISQVISPDNLISQAEPEPELRPDQEHIKGLGVFQKSLVKRLKRRL